MTHEKLEKNEMRTVCPFDCPDCCGIIAKIENGKVVGVRGDQDHPRTKGFLCRKMKNYEQMINHPERILYPMKRTGKKGEGRFERISWQDAIWEITEKWKGIISDYGSEAILPYSYAGTEGILQQHCGEAFFHYMGASKLKRTICSSGKGAGWKAVMGDTLGMSAYRLKECDRILVWGSNIAATRIHEIPYIREAREKGAKVTLIDVYETPAAAYCDDVILVRPGTDGALALAMIHVLEEEGLTDHKFIDQYVEGYDLLLKDLPDYNPEWAEQITGVPSAMIKELAISYGKAQKPAILHGSGPSRRKNGGMMVRTIAALPAVVGSLANGFGMCGIKQTGNWGDMTMIKRPDFDQKNARTINMMQLATALDPSLTNDPVVMSMYVYCSNPAMITTKQKHLLKMLEREDLYTVVHERFMTDTAKYADIILPATFSTETYDIFHGYGLNSIQYSRKVSEKPGECYSNWDTFAMLAEAMGFEDSYFKMTEEEVCLKYMDRHSGQQVELTEEEWSKILDGQIVERRLLGVQEIKTESGKIMLYNPDMEEALISYKEERIHEKYPLRLVAAPSLYSLNSTFTTQEDLMRKRGRMTLLMAKDDAEARGIQDGEIVYCHNDLACVPFYAKVIGGILPGTVVVEGVYTSKESINGLTMNALIGEELSDLGEATTMNGNWVEIYK